MNGNAIRTFLGANTPAGFRSFFPEFIKERRNYIIKGGPGTGKSTLMRKAAARALREGDFTEYVYCSSDPDSLDAVYIPSKNLVAADGTAPHTLEPVCAGPEGNIVNMGECWSEDILRRNEADIKMLSAKSSASYAKAYRYIAAAGAAASDIRACGEDYVLRDKINAFASSLARKYIPKKPSASSHTEKRFISGITPRGIVVFADTFYTLCRRVIPISDPYGVSESILRTFAEKAKASGLEVWEFYHPLTPDTLSGVAVPQTETAICASSSAFPVEPQQAHCINIRRFIDGDIAKEKQRLAFNAKLIKACLERAVAALAQAKAFHDDLEDIYISAMDYGKAERAVKAFLKKIYP